MQSKVKLLNSNSVWDEKRRYKINSVVNYNGQTYQNITGSNSLPSDSIDWIVAVNNNVVNLTTAQTIDGIKTFLQPIIVPSAVSNNQAVNLGQVDTKVDKVLGERLINDTEITKLSNQSGTNTGDETTISIQNKRPIKTINGNSVEGNGNIDILSNLPIVDAYTKVETDDLLDTKATLVNGKVPGEIIKYSDNTTIEAVRNGFIQNNDNTTPRTFKIKSSSATNEPSGNLEIEIPSGYSIQNIEGVLRLVGGYNYAWSVFSEIHFVNRTDNQDYIRFLIDKYGVPTSKNGLTVENLPDATNLVGYDKQIVVNADGKFGKVDKPSNAITYYNNAVQHDVGISSNVEIITRGVMVQVSVTINNNTNGDIYVDEGLTLLQSESIPIFVNNQFYISLSSGGIPRNDLGCTFYQNDEGTTEMYLLSTGITVFPSYNSYSGILTFINTMT